VTTASPTQDVYPRRELCPACERVEVDVIGPGDTWSLCHLCHLEMMDVIVPTIAEVMRDAERHARWLMENPDRSDDAIADAVLVLRRARGEQPLEMAR
jgi:hypothetical protein